MAQDNSLSSLITAAKQWGDENIGAPLSKGLDFMGKAVASNPVALQLKYGNRFKELTGRSPTTEELYLVEANPASLEQGAFLQKKRTDPVLDAGGNTATLAAANGGAVPIQAPANVAAPGFNFTGVNAAPGEVIPFDSNAFSRGVGEGVAESAYPSLTGANDFATEREVNPALRNSTPGLEHSETELDLLRGNKIRGNIQTGATALNTVAGLATAYTGFEQLKLAKESFKFNKQVTAANFNNQVSLANLQLGDYQRARLASGTSATKTSDFIAKQGVKNL